MDDLEARIGEFEKKYLGQIKQWAAHVDPNELDAVHHTIQDLDRHSKTISAAMIDSNSALKTRWKKLLDDVRGMTPAILNHLETIRDQARQGMDKMGHGQRGLAGYRNSSGGKRTIFDQNA